MTDKTFDEDKCGLAAFHKWITDQQGFIVLEDNSGTVSPEFIKSYLDEVKSLKKEASSSAIFFDEFIHTSEPFIIVVTDGDISDEAEYRNFIKDGASL